ncbi:hypothetical protein E3P84_03521 [Wallemia ichthyophaga]|nr:hypothetical protein E3P84_03521 [Wallemia ichthyophaga]TIB39509.1 hypothetical protein E3P83_03447 [Wallemia ichthyophaga]
MHKAYTSEQEINKYFVQYLVIAACHLIEATAILVRNSAITLKIQLIWHSIFQEAGLPDGCLNIIHSSRESTPSVIEKILADNRLREVCFSRSSNLGRQMGRLSDYYLKPSELEAS